MSWTAVDGSPSTSPAKASPIWQRICCDWDGTARVRKRWIGWRNWCRPLVAARWRCSLVGVGWTPPPTDSPTWTDPPCWFSNVATGGISGSTFRRGPVVRARGHDVAVAGVDVPGAACIQVVIDRIPFRGPTILWSKPAAMLWSAMAATASFSVSVPRAALLLAQERDGSYAARRTVAWWRSWIRG